MKFNMADSFSDPQDKKQIQELRYRLERISDFLEWLFDNELDYSSQDEMWERFEKQDAQSDGVQECVATKIPNEPEAG